MIKLLLLLDSSLNRHFDGESICSFAPAPAPANASAILWLGKILRGRTSVSEDELEELPVFVLSN